MRESIRNLATMHIQLTHCAARHPASSLDSLALQPITLSIASGEQVAVIGPSGAGKTTLLHVLACAIAPAAGQLQLNNQNPWTIATSQLQQLRGNLWLAPQVPPLPPRQRVVTSVLAGQLPRMNLLQSLRSLFYPRDISAAHAALAAFDLGDKLFERVDRLSGGERQRVGLARGLVTDAKLWLVDEPLSALDPSRAVQAIETLTQNAQAQGATLVTSLHHVEMALKHFPRIIGLKDGELAFDLPSSEVTSGRLAALYAQHLDELHGAAPEPAMLTDAALPVVMHCR
jgi:phosphonate transport system ATP-binding protein